MAKHVPQLRGSVFWALSLSAGVPSLSLAVWLTPLRVTVEPDRGVVSAAATGVPRRLGPAQAEHREAD